MSIGRWTNGIVAIWLAWSAFLGFSVIGNLLNLVSVGLVMAGVGIALREETPWQGWTATIAGFWLIVIPLFSGLLSGSGLVWNSLVVAAAVLLASVPLGSWSSERPAVAPPVREKAAETVPSKEGGWKEEPSEATKELVHH